MRQKYKSGVRSRSRKYYNASEVVVFMLMRAAELETKGRPDSLYKSTSALAPGALNV